MTQIIGIEITRMFGTRVCLLLAALALLVGCGKPEAEFRLNALYLVQQERAINSQLTEEQKQNLKDVMYALFGTPDEPKLPQFANVNVQEFLDVSQLRMAAGPVGRDETTARHGLYREHCAHCHGITGDGRGPTSEFLDPYPRDYRRGLFKFKSTTGREPPTDDDLHRILVNGIPGTAMPSFKLLDGHELEALAEYVKYLSIRGEVERQLIFLMANELEVGQLLANPQASSEELQESMDMIGDMVELVVSKWQGASENVTPIPPPPEDIAMEESISRGRELFFGTVANCAKCHGDTALGSGVQDDYDDWTKELEPKNPEALAVYSELEALPPRNSVPRNLRMNIFRGGRRPIDIYWRIRNGIGGTPMPAGEKLSSDEIWHLVHYVRSLAYEPVSEPPQDQPAYQRDRL